MTAEDLIKLLKLQPHPREGGFFRETYKAEEMLSATALPSRYGFARAVGTAIYYLLKPNTISAMHRLASDEIFHLYLGGPLRMLQLHPDGHGQTVLLGSDFAAGHSPQVIVPRGVWQGSTLEPGVPFALLGCTVAPGFDYADYEHGKRDELIAQYPAFAEWIRKLT